VAGYTDYWSGHSDGYHAQGAAVAVSNKRTPMIIEFLDFARSRGLRVADSSFQRPQRYRWTWYSNAGCVAKEIDHVLIDGRWRMIQNCSVHRSTQSEVAAQIQENGTIPAEANTKKIPKF